MGVSFGSSIYNAPSIYESGAGGGGGDSSTIGGRKYKTLTIDEVTWLAENLDYKFSGCGIGGDDTPSTPNAWYYNNDEATYGIDGTRKCGLLYNWYAVKFLNDNKDNLIPGWHVPTKYDWETLINAVGGTVIAGTKLKSIDGAADGSWPTGWNGIDEYGFNVFPAGNRVSDLFDYVGIRGRYWTLTEYSSTIAYDILFDTGASVNINSFSEYYNSFSVRLVKD